MAYDIQALGNVPAFEDWLFDAATQEWQQRGRQGIWGKTADQYIRQRAVLEYNPYPPEENQTRRDAVPPSIKQVYRHTELEELYRWGIDGAKTGNHRLLFVIHEGKKVLLLHYFDKTYNGAIRRPDIVPAERCYDTYGAKDSK
ncbi:hypothetical protein [Marinococcus sp. PL1-022]|uniref:hypothetical protein n=1 Tax=Marinococcus sp. PL1-022 TaxID=3095363 RepID=UPI0029C1CA6C|nr:hypothetical protein [Marinococcus sp. PL1-022]MDX6154542.1 hypothetical protein [Marinococcus sp. PL1-022]